MLYPENMDISASGIALASAVAVVGVGMLFFLTRRRSRQVRDTKTLHKSIEQELHLPPTLHPVT